MEKVSDIVEGCRRGCDRSYSLLYSQYSGYLARVVGRYFTDQDTVNDLVQETFIRVYEKLGSYGVDNSFQGWIGRIARNLAIDRLRRSRVEVELLDFNQAWDPHLEAELAAVEEELVGEIRLRLELVSPASRRVFDLFVFDDWSHAQIAEELGISTGSSKSNLFKAKAKIKSGIVEYKNKL